MKNLLLSLGFISILFVSCSEVEPVDPVLLGNQYNGNNNNNNGNNGNNNGGNTTTPALLTKIIESYADGTVETTTFNYNGNKIASYSNDLNDIDETIFTYTGNLITQEEYSFDDGAGESFNEITAYQYDTNERLIKSTRTETSSFGTVITVDDFTYNSNGTVTFSTTVNSILDATGTIYFNGNQPFKKEVTHDIGTAWEGTTIEENFYDDKVNPFNNVTGFSKIEIACPTYHYGYYGMPNNVIEIKEDGVSKETSTYTYNSNNMPATEVYIDNSNNDYNSTSQYIYN